MKDKNRVFWAGFCLTAIFLCVLVGLLAVGNAMTRQGLGNPPLTAWDFRNPAHQSITLLGHTWVFPTQAINEGVGWIEARSVWLLPRSLRLAGQLITLMAQNLSLPLFPL